MTQARYPRNIMESGLDARIACIVEPEIESLGFRLVRTRLSGQNGLTLQIMVERPDGMIDVGECEKVSRALSPLLDIEEPVQGPYNLEISSPGIDRPLVRLSDFDMWAGHMAKVETKREINGLKRFKGVILSTQDDKVTFLQENVDSNEEARLTLAVTGMASARLMLTDNLIREALRRDKAARRVARGDSKTEYMA